MSQDDHLPVFFIELADGPPKPRGRLILFGQDLGIRENSSDQSRVRDSPWMLLLHASRLSPADWATIALAGATAIAAGAAAVSAFWARKAAKETRTAAEGQLALALISKYSDIEMAEALSAVRVWFDQYMDDPVGSWLTDLRREGSSPSESARRLDAARRTISHYFLAAARLGRSGYLSEEALRIVACDQSGISVMFPYVWQLEVGLAGGEPDQGDMLRWLACKCGDVSLDFPAAPSE